ncbi:type 1 glutamine amidotransferase [Persephonella sp.]
MRLHYLQHVHFETPANIFKWAKEKGYEIEGTKIFLGEKLPAPDQFDLLIIMGGPMGVYDEKEFPWLVEEKRFIERVIKANRKILGICLGAQLLADVMGAKVYKNKYKEIGWFDLSLTERASESKFFSDFPKKFTAFHWHGDTFDIPEGAIHIAESEGCKNQAFEYDGRIVGLQFHLETNIESAEALIQNSVEELKEEGKYIQSDEEILSKNENFIEIEKLLFKLLSKFEER